MDVYVDPATGAYQRVVIDPDGKYETTYDGTRATREVDGKRFLSAWRYGNSKSLYAYTKIEPNAAIAADELHPPKQTATWTFGEGPRQRGADERHLFRGSSSMPSSTA